MGCCLSSSKVEVIGEMKPPTPRQTRKVQAPAARSVGSAGAESTPESGIKETPTHGKLTGLSKMLFRGDNNGIGLTVSRVDIAVEHLELTEGHLKSGVPERLAGQYPNLVSVRFDLGNDIDRTNWEPTDSQLASLRHMKSLTSVDASRCCVITRKGLTKISDEPGKITTLILQGCEQFQDMLIPALGIFSNLQTLNLRGCKELTNRGIKNVEYLKNLTWLDISLYANVSVWDPEVDDSTLVSNDAMKHVGKLSKLTHLEMETLDQVDNIGINDIDGLTNLVYLDVGRTQVSNSALYVFSTFTNLDTLKMSACAISDITVPKLLALTKLTYLDLSHKGGLSDPSLQKLQALPSLTHLDVSFCGHITVAGIKHLAAYPKLTYLEVAGCAGINDTTCAVIAKLTQLERLNLNKCDAVTDDGVALLAALPKLTHLEVGSTGFKTVQIDRLNEVTNLTDVTLHWVCKAENNRIGNLRNMGLNVHVV